MWRRLSRRCAPAGAMFRREAYRLEAMSWQPHVGVVDPRRPLAYRLQWAVPRSCPVRAARHGVVAGSEEQAVGRGEVVLVDPLAQHRHEHRRDRNAARTGLGFAGLVEGDVGNRADTKDARKRPSTSSGSFTWRRSRARRQSSTLTSRRAGRGRLSVRRWARRTRASLTRRRRRTRTTDTCPPLRRVASSRSPHRSSRR